MRIEFRYTVLGREEAHVKLSCLLIYGLMTDCMLTVPLLLITKSPNLYFHVTAIIQSSFFYVKIQQITAIFGLNCGNNLRRNRPNI